MLAISDLKWTLACCCAHFAIRTVLRAVYGDRRSTEKTMGGKEQPGGASMIREVLAYNAITVSYQVFCAYVGASAWFDGTAAAVGGTANDRMYAHSALAEQLVLATFAFEVYNTIAVLILPEYCTAAFVAHRTRRASRTDDLWPVPHIP